MIREDRKNAIDGEVGAIERLILYLNHDERRYLKKKIEEVISKMWIRPEEVRKRNEEVRE